MPATDRRPDDPLARFRPGWTMRARNARDTWLSGTFALETAMEQTFREGVAFAAEILEQEGARELAVKVRMQVQRRA